MVGAPRVEDPSPTLRGARGRGDAILQVDGPLGPGADRPFNGLHRGEGLLGIRGGLMGAGKDPPSLAHGCSGLEGPWPPPETRCGLGA